MVMAVHFTCDPAVLWVNVVAEGSERSCVSHKRTRFVKVRQKEIETMLGNAVR